MKSKFRSRLHFDRKRFVDSFQSATLIVLAIVVVQPVNAQDERRRGGDRGFDAIRYLSRADRDENGVLDERELGGRLKEYVSEMGIDTSKPVSVAKITRAYEAKKKNEADDLRAKEIDGRRQVSKFGSDVELLPPPNFAVDSVAGAAGRLEDQYEKEMVDTVKAYMSRYDENKDGWLDENESRRIRRILGEDADADKNGKLGEMEVAAALSKRTNSESERRRGSSDRGRFERGNSERFVRSGGESRQPERENGSRSFRGSSTTQTPSVKVKVTSPTSSPSSGRSLTGRQTAYIDGVFSRYDDDKNGTLSKDEQSKISGSLKLVDVNGDGEVDRQEALDSLAGTAKPAASPTETKEGNTDRSRPSRRRPRGESSDDEDSREKQEPTRSTASRSAGSDIKYDIKGFQNVPIKREQRSDKETDLERRGADSKFLSFDNNTDGQISMAEFRGGKQWTDELVGKFQLLDDNDDGVVTIDEFKANYNARDSRDSDD